MVLLLALVVGQCPPGQYCPPAVVYRGQQQFVMTDQSGKQWSSPDPKWLGEWVGQKNIEIAASAALRSPAVPPAAEPPVPVSPSAGTGGVLYPEGVIEENIPWGQKPRTWGNSGLESPKDQPSPPAPKQKSLHLTLVGATAKQVLAKWRTSPDFRSMETSMGDGLHVQCYKPGDPMIKGLKFEDGGNPDVILERGGGKTLYRSHADPGAAVIVSEVRRADPNYDPKKDPDGSPLKGWLGGIEDWQIGATEMAVGLGILLMALLLRSKKS